MRKRLMRKRPRVRARFVRWLELASDDPLRRPEERLRAEQGLRSVKEALKAQAMYVYRDRSPEWRVGLHTYRQWHRYYCDCGVEGSTLDEIDIRIWPLQAVAVDVEGFLDLTADGEIVCRRCRFLAEQKPNSPQP